MSVALLLFYFLCSVVELQVTKLGSLQHTNTILFSFFPLLPPQTKVQDMSTWMIIAAIKPTTKELTLPQITTKREINLHAK
jgi:hypothetical protein